MVGMVQYIQPERTKGLDGTEGSQTAGLALLYWGDIGTLYLQYQFKFLTCCLKNT